MKNKFRSFKEAREFVYTLHLSGARQWREYCTTGNKPHDIPAKPDNMYKKNGWMSWGDFLGTGNISTHKKQFKDFEDARKFIQSQGFTDQKQWRNFIRSGKKPKNIPSNPNAVYKDEWKGYVDWFGKSFLSYDEARELVQKLGLKSYTEWIKLRESNKKPKNIPSNPADYYEKEFKGWGDFLGTGNIAPQNREFLSYDDAKKTIKKYKIHTQKEYRNLAKIGKLPKNIPRSPQKSYDKFKSWGDFLGTGRIANQDRKFISYENAKEQVKKLGITTLRSWQKAVTKHKIPKNIPTSPPRTYKKEWVSWGDFLGTGNIAPQNREFLPWKEAKPLYQKIVKENNLKKPKDWEKYVRTHRLPNDLPADPNRIYTEERVRETMK